MVAISLSVCLVFFSALLSARLPLSLVFFSLVAACFFWTKYFRAFACSRKTTYERNSREGRVNVVTKYLNIIQKNGEYKW
jgi:hypothetical protein